MGTIANSIDRVDILGVMVSAVTPRQACAAIEGWIDRRTRDYVCVTGVHGVMESGRDPALRAIHNRAGLVVPDGMPLVWMARHLGFTATRRVYGPDLMQAMMAASVRGGHRHLFYGGGEGTAERLKAVLARTYPGLQVVGTITPPFRALSASEDAQFVDAINAARPDIVWVGLSTPKQERWMAAHRGRLECPALIGVGAAFDFLSGRKRQAPAWMQRNGLEWLFRLTFEPRRLAGRYIRNNPAFIYKALRQVARQRQHGLLGQKAL